MARYKGDLRTLAEGAAALGALTDESRVLISEGCTHHRQCEDIGTVKMPAWIRGYCGANPTFEFTQGHGFPDDVSGYDVVVHCGGCMLNEKEMRWRQSVAARSGTPMVNYGAAIACVHGILGAACGRLCDADPNQGAKFKTLRGKIPVASSNARPAVLFFTLLSF